MTFEVGRLSAALTLDGLDKFNSGLDQAGRKLTDTGKAADSATQTFSQGIRKAATESQSELNLVGSAFTKVGLAAGAASAVAITKFANFDQAMSNVTAATHETTENMKLLEQAALDAGARTVFSATEAAGAVEELSKAGVSTKDILGGGLDGALDLAAAGGLGVADAAGIAAVALKTFNLEGSQMGHVADLLAAGAGKAMGDVTDLSAALNQSSMVAKASGLTIEETTAALSAFASQGLLGSDAGTSFKTMLMSLQGPTGEAAALMEKLGISAYDQQGKFAGLANFAGQLETALAGMSEEQRQSTLKTIFGSDAIRAATVLYSEGANGIREWEDAVNDQGYAAETAAMRLDNLKGDIEALGGALDTALIQTGSGANDMLRDMVQMLTEAVDAYNALPAPMQSAVMGIGLLTAGVFLLGGAFMTATVKVAEFKAASATLGMTAGNARRGLGAVGTFLGGPWGVALASAALAVHLFNNAMEDSKTSADEFVTAVKQGESAVATMRDAATQNEGGATKLFVDVEQHLRDIPALADKAATSGRGFWSAMSFNENAALDTIKEFGDGLSQIASTDLPRAQKAFAQFVTESGITDAQALTLFNEEMGAFKSTLLDTATAAGIATDDATLLELALGRIDPATSSATKASEANSAALEALSGAAQSAETDIDSLKATIEGFGSATLDARAANRELEAAFDDLQASIAANGTTLDIGTEQGRANEAALDAIAVKAKQASAATLEQTGSHEEATLVLERGRAELIANLEQFGITGTAAEQYADRLGLIPSNVGTAVQLTNYDDAMRKAANIAQAIRDIPGYRDVVINQVVKETGAPRGQVGAAYNFLGGMYSTAGRHFADGGFASGIYSGVIGGIPKLGVDGTPHIFAEKELGVDWETYISSRASKARNASLLMETANRIGFPVVPVSALRGVRAFADGGMAGGGTARVPSSSMFGRHVVVNQDVKIEMPRADTRPVVRELARNFRDAIDE